MLAYRDNMSATVKLLQFALPARSPSAAVERELQAAALNAWLNALPLANTTLAAQQLLEHLQRDNRAMVAAPLRYQAAETLRPAVDGLIETLKSRYLGAVLPLSTRNRAHAVMVHGLLEEMGHAYKIIIIDLLGAATRTTVEHQILLNTLPRAVSYLGQIVLGHYLSHEADPADVWGELQRLYLYAEQCLDPAETATLDSHNESARRLVTEAYLRIALLALASPYHLMPGEADSVYQELASWCSLCTIITPQPGDSLAGKFLVDLDTVAPPRYCSAAMTGEAATPRIIDLHELVAALDDQIKALSVTRDKSSGEAIHMNLSQRLRRDRLQRLKRAWGGRADRKIPRSARQARVYISIGLSTCHHFIAGEIPFMPERDEVRLHRGASLPQHARSSLSLVPMDAQHWKLQDESDRLERGVTQPRVSQFDTESAELDIWHKIHSTTAQTSQGTERSETLHSTKVLRLKNQGAGGLCLDCDGQGHVHTRVGEVVAYKSEADPVADWRIGTIRWLRCRQDGALELGLMRIGDDAVAVAVRAIAGVGTGGEYFRALISSGNAESEHESLIVPAAMYDIDTILVLNSGNDLRYARLSRLVTTSTSFTQFDFEPAQPPKSELDKIASIKSLNV